MRFRKDKAVCILTVEQIRAALEVSVAGAEELREALERSHLEGYSRAMSLSLHNLSLSDAKHKAERKRAP